VVKSTAKISLAWLSQKRFQVVPFGVPPSTMKLRIVPVLWSTPSFSFISRAIRSSPQLGLSDEMRRMNSMWRRGIRGRPGFPFDLHRQNWQ